MVPIGNWVLIEACDQLAKWQKNDRYKHLCLSINISTKQIWQKNFVDLVINAVSKSGLDPSKLKLEITESVLAKDIDDTAKKLQKLKSFGISFSLDDFGTGYSSLSYLKNLPIDELKIDQSFIRDLMIDPSDLIMVKSLISLGENFGINVVAEGVETEAQFDKLKSFSCNIYQGYYFSYPLPMNQFLQLLN
ncbi:MAG: EAL domain-containing protein [Kangiellaceae bacterium]